jgi:hypothetical protein
VKFIKSTIVKWNQTLYVAVVLPKEPRHTPPPQCNADMRSCTANAPAPYIKGLFILKMIVARDLTRYILFQVYIIMAKFDSGKGTALRVVSPAKQER